MVPITPIRMVCRLTLWHSCARACFNPLCCSVALASCCSGRASSHYFTSMRWTSQREGCTACMSLWWPFFVPTGSMQTASGLEQDQSSSAERFGRSHWGKGPVGHMCRLDQTLLSHLCFASNICENDVPSKITFDQGFYDEPGSNVMSLSHHVLNWSILTTRKHMDLAVWLMTQQTRWISSSAVEVGHFLSVKSTFSKFHDISLLRYIDSCIAPEGIASCKIHGGEQSLPIVIV